MSFESGATTSSDRYQYGPCYHSRGISPSAPQLGTPNSSQINKADATGLDPEAVDLAGLTRWNVPPVCHQSA